MSPGTRPTFFDLGGAQFPAPSVGRQVEGLGGSVREIYTEALAAAKAGAYTGCVTLCRTLLLHIAVERGSKPPEAPFKQHVQYLVDTGAIPKQSLEWVDAIRVAANLTVHDLAVANQADAKQVLDFTQMVLTIVYEFASRFPQRAVTSK
ncbi:MAG: DUF4145 domain-containing protein [Myxococcaceae bacterium]